MNNHKRKWINQQHPIIFIMKRLIKKSLNEVLKVWIKNFIYFMIVLLYTEAIRQILLRIPGLQHFPPSVIGMILFCLFLVIVEKCLPYYIHQLLSLFQTQAEFALKYMNILFVPSTLNIINSNQINGIIFIKVAVLFAFAYVIIFLLCIGSVKLLRFLLYYTKNRNSNNQHLNNDHHEENDENKDDSSLPTIHTNQLSIPIHLSQSSRSSLSDQIEQHEQIISSRSSHSSITIHDITKKSIQIENEPIDERIINQNHQTNENNNKEEKKQNRKEIENNKNEEEYEEKEVEEEYQEMEINEWLKNKWDQWQPSMDFVIFFIIFMISTMLYIALPNDHSLLPSTRLVSQLTLTIIIYLLASHTPLKIKLIIHPLISTTAIMLACLGYLHWIKINNMINNDDNDNQIVKAAVRIYYTNTHTFFTWIEGTPVDGYYGAGDVLASAMNVAIVSLALTVFLNKPKDVRQWMILFITAIPMVLLSLLVVPLIAHLILIPSEIALAMTTRTVTTAIGIAISQIIHSNVGIVTCFQAFSAISGPLIGIRLLKWTRVKQDDYLTIGISMGFNSHALATAFLYETNRKASSIASLAFMLFGTLAVIFTSIPQISNTMMSNAGTI